MDEWHCYTMILKSKGFLPSHRPAPAQTARTGPDSRAVFHVYIYTIPSSMRSSPIKSFRKFASRIRSKFSRSHNHNHNHNQDHNVPDTDDDPDARFMGPITIFRLDLECASNGTHEKACSRQRMERHMARNTAPFHLWDNQREIPIPQPEVDEDDMEIIDDPVAAELENQRLVFEDMYKILTQNSKRGMIEQRWDGDEGRPQEEGRDTSFEVHYDV